MGQTVSGDTETMAQRVGTVHPVPRLRRRDPPGAVLDQAIESLNARFRRAVNAKRHFPTEQAALQTPYLVARSLDPKGTGQTRWTMRWKPALNAFAVTFARPHARRPERLNVNKCQLHRKPDSPHNGQR